MAATAVKDAVAAVLGAGANAYDAVRSLAECSIPAMLLTPTKPVDGHYPGAELVRCPAPESADALVSFLNDSVCRGRPVVLIPTTDAFVLFLARHGLRLGESLLYFQPSPDLVASLSDKTAFSEVCRRAGLASPATLVLHNEAEVRETQGRIPLPCIIKRPGPGAWGKSFAGKGFYAASLQEFEPIAGRALSQGAPLLVQEWIPGPATEIFFVSGFYNERHAPEKVSIGRKLMQYPLQIGTASLACLEWNDEVAQLADRFAFAASYKGLVDIEFKRDPRDGQYKIIEVNARVGQFHRVGADGRWNLVAYFFHCLTGNAALVSDYQPHAEGRLWIYPQHHMCSCIEQRGLLRGVASWVRDMCRSDQKCAWDIWDLRRSFRDARVVLGHIRRLRPQTILRGCGRAGSNRA